jgi:hypothetical protein
MLMALHLWAERTWAQHHAADVERSPSPADGSGHRGDSRSGFGFAT